MEKEALLKRGFLENTWTDEGETFTEFKLIIGRYMIEISGETLIEVGETHGNTKVFITVPNCKTIKDLDNLIRLFGL